MHSEKIDEICGYCGLSGVLIKGEGYPAYRKRCLICHIKDHFAAVCKTSHKRPFSCSRENEHIQSSDKS